MGLAVAWSGWQLLRDALVVALDAVPAGNSSEAFTQYVREDIARWAKVVKAAGIAPQ